MVDKDKLKELLKIVNNVDEFVESLDDEKLKDLLYKLNNQAIKNMIQDTATKGGPSKHDLDILIAIQSFKSQEQSLKSQEQSLVFLTYKLMLT